MLTRRALLAGLGTSVAGGLNPRVAADRQPNFLFLIADDHAAYVLGADGNRLAQTPHLDRLASEGVRFTRHFCNSPVCTASRQSFFTGQLPHAAGVTRLPTPLAPDKPTLARALRDAGYATAVFGKMHFNRPSSPGLHGFDSLMTEDDVERSWSRLNARPIPPDIRPKALPWRPLRSPAREWLNADKLPYPRYAAEMKGTYIAEQACRFLEQRPDQPFALWVSFMEPHSPFDFPVEDRAAYLPGQFPPPRVGPEDAWQVPLIFRDLSANDKSGITAAYYTSVRFLDRSVGAVLEKLRAENLERSTFVVYLADHGYNLGHHGRFEKHCGYDPALRVPLIMRLPARFRPRVVTDMTEHVDVTATILDVLDVPPLAVQHGQSLRPYLEGARPPRPRNHIFSEYLENEEAFIRTSRYKLVYCSGKRARQDGYMTDRPTPGRYVRLYDLKNDPAEFHDVAARHPDVVARLEALMLDRFRATHPEAPGEPKDASREEALDWYVRPRDA